MDVHRLCPLLLINSIRLGRLAVRAWSVVLSWLHNSFIRDVSGSRLISLGGRNSREMVMLGRQHMKHKVIAGILLLSTAIVLLALPQHAATRSPSNSQGQNAPAPAPAMDMSLPTEPTPAFHTQLPRTPLPATLDPTLFTTTVVQNAYIVAARIKNLLYQQPCYCNCDRSEGQI